MFRFDVRLAYRGPRVMMLGVATWLFRRRSGYASGNGDDDPVGAPHGRDGLPREEQSRPWGAPTGSLVFSASGCRSRGRARPGGRGRPTPTRIRVRRPAATPSPPRSARTAPATTRSAEHTSELQSLMRIS